MQELARYILYKYVRVKIITYVMFKKIKMIYLTRI